MRRTALAAGIGVACSLLSVGSAVAAPHVVLWSGGLAPGTTAAGVEVRPDGTARRLSEDARGRVHRGGAFTVRGARLARIAAAADAVLAHAPSFSHNPLIDDGTYVTAAVTDGGRSKLVLDENADPSQVATLLDRANAVLPRAGQLAGASAQTRAAARVARILKQAAPDSAACPAGQHVVTATKELSLHDAAEAGAIDRLGAKGTAGGDAVSVDAHNGPDVNATSAELDVNIQVSSGMPGVDAEGAMERIENAIASEPQRTSVHVDNGTPEGMDVDFVYHFTPRDPGAAPTPCAVQMLLVTSAPDVRSYARGGSDASPGAVVLNRADPTLPATIQHELGHTFGFKDVGDPVWQPSDGSPAVPLPAGAGDEGSSALAQFLAANGIDPTSGHVVNGSDPEAHDVMADPTDPESNFTAAELTALLAGASLSIKGEPGTLLADKTGSAQSFVLGALLDLLVPDGQSVHEDGIVAYCIDLLDHETPGPNDVFDVLPKAGALGGPAMSALQRVADVVAAREPGPLEETPEANAAIWRVTDDASVPREALPGAASILDAAGVPLDAGDLTFHMSHIVDPAAGISHTVALASPTDPTPQRLPPLPVPSTRPLLARLVAARQVRLLHGRGHRRGHRSALVVARVTLAGVPDRVALTLLRPHGHGLVAVARTRAVTLPVGATSVPLLALDPKPGRYVLVARSRRGGTRQLALAIADRSGRRRR